MTKQLELCADCGHEKDNSSFHLEAPGSNWGAALHHFKPPQASGGSGPLNTNWGGAKLRVPRCPKCGSHVSGPLVRQTPESLQHDYLLVVQCDNGACVYEVSGYELADFGQFFALGVLPSAEELAKKMYELWRIAEIKRQGLHAPDKPCTAIGTGFISCVAGFYTGSFGRARCSFLEERIPAWTDCGEQEEWTAKSTESLAALAALGQQEGK